MMAIRDYRADVFEKNIWTDTERNFKGLNMARKFVCLLLAGQTIGSYCKIVRELLFLR